MKHNPPSPHTLALLCVFSNFPSALLGLQWGNFSLEHAQFSTVDTIIHSTTASRDFDFLSMHREWVIRTRARTLEKTGAVATTTGTSNPPTQRN
ncbi:hypothetical protein BDN67DRAFT_822267 [Paxillus ammoniavirescens]|nr:hypothetical protein BDN67DRAFT_822267 [Paxillus ammoniavirescens]